MYTSMFDTKFISILQPSRFYTPGDIGPKHYTDYQFFVRAEEAALDASFNTQSQTPDVLDILLPSLRVSTQELEVSFNTQDQDPDDPCHVQDFQCFRVIFSKCHSMMTMFSQDPRSITSRTSSFNCRHQTVTGTLTTYFNKTLSRCITVMSFSFVVHGLHLKVKVVCVHSVGLGSSGLFSGIFLNISRGSTLFTFMYFSFA